MLQRWMEYAPAQWGAAGLWVAALGALCGVVLWLGGARFGRSTVTLVLVTAGSVVGKLLPGWMGWSVDPMGTGMAGALVLGVAGYLLYPLWIALALGVMLGLWTAWGTWVFLGTAPLALPSISAGTTCASFSQDLWSMLGPTLRYWLPITCTGALIAGCGIGLLWRRLGVALLFSLLGVSILLSMALLAALIRWPGGLEKIPARHATQAGILASLVVVGLVAQYRFAPRVASPDRSGADEDDDDA